MHWCYYFLHEKTRHLSRSTNKALPQCKSKHADKADTSFSIRFLQMEAVIWFVFFF